MGLGAELPRSDDKDPRSPAPAGLALGAVMVALVLVILWWARG
jgi:hypothetical protein